MRELLEILERIDDTRDWEHETGLIDDRKLDSFEIILLVSELEEAFGIQIAANELIPQNLNSAEAMWKMVQRLQEI